MTPTEELANPWQRSGLVENLNSEFRCGEGTLVLTEVADMGSQRDPDTGRPFSCLFRGNLEAGQGTFQLKHPELGEAALFLVPLGPENDEMVYEAIFT